MESQQQHVAIDVPQRPPRRSVARAVIAIGIVLALVVLVVQFLIADMCGGEGMRVRATQASGETVMGAVRQYQLSTGSPPASFSALVGPYLEKTPTDGWRRPFMYTLDAKGTVRLLSCGADGKPGGTGQDADLWWEWPVGGESKRGIGNQPR